MGSSVTDIAADVVATLHYLLVGAVLVSFVVPAGEWLKYQIILICCIILDWNDGDAQCALTAIESKLRGTWRPGGAADGDDTPAFWHPFVSRVLRRFGVTLSRLQADRLVYFIFVSALLSCFLRFCVYKGIPLRPSGSVGRAYGWAFGLLAALWFVNAAWRVQ
jgi:hypothetical protein